MKNMVSELWQLGLNPFTATQEITVICFVKGGLKRTWGWEASNSTEFGIRSRSTSGKTQLPGKDRNGN